MQYYFSICNTFSNTLLDESINRGLVCAHAFHCMDSKDPDIPVPDRWMPASKTYPACTIHEDRMWLPLWSDKKRLHTQKSHPKTVNPSCSWEGRRIRRRNTVCLVHRSWRAWWSVTAWPTSCWRNTWRWTTLTPCWGRPTTMSPPLMAASHCTFSGNWTTTCCLTTATMQPLTGRLFWPDLMDENNIDMFCVVWLGYLWAQNEYFRKFSVIFAHEVAPAFLYLIQLS